MVCNVRATGHDDSFRTVAMPYFGRAGGLLPILGVKVRGNSPIPAHGAHIAYFHLDSEEH